MSYRSLTIRSSESCRWDVLSLGETMLRFDPGHERIAHTRSFRVWEGGAEYNVARGLRSCFGQRAAIVTALVNNPVGRLVEDLMRQGGVDVSEVLWREFDGIGREARNGTYFLERGFGVRGALGCMDRGHTAISQVEPGQIDWNRIFGVEGVRWFHTGGIFSGLSASTLEVAREAMQAARQHGVIVSYDCNYRPSLWRARGGRQAAATANRELAPHVDVLFGHESDVALELTEASHGPPLHTAETYAEMATRVAKEYPGLCIIATPTRRARTAGRNDWGAFAYADGTAYAAEEMRDLDVFDRVGGGDGFAAGLIYGLLQGRDIEWSLRCAVAHGALAMTTPGDSSFATLGEVLRLMDRAGANVQR